MGTGRQGENDDETCRRRQQETDRERERERGKGGRREGGSKEGGVKAGRREGRQEGRKEHRTNEGPKLMDAPLGSRSWSTKLNDQSACEGRKDS